MRDNMKVCVIGGSNSLMRQGYVAPLISTLEQKLSCNVTLENLAIGGTFSHFGLWQLATKDRHFGADVIVVEYALNDHELGRWGALQHWARAYEGLIRRLRADCPSAQIISPLFYGRNSTLSPQLSAIHAGTALINLRYGVTSIDVTPQLFAQTVQDFPDPGKDWFSDPSHYAEPLQAMIADMVVEAVLAGGGRATAESIAPVSGAHFAEAKSAVREGVFESLLPEGCERTSYQNSAINEMAVRLTRQTPLAFQVQGSLVALILMSTSSDGVVRLAFGDRTVDVALRRTAIDDQKYTYLLNVIIPDQYFRANVCTSTVPTRFSLSLLSPEEISAAPKKIEHRSSARMPDPREHTFDLIDILYTGQILPA